MDKQFHPALPKLFFSGARLTEGLMLAFIAPLAQKATDLKKPITQGELYAQIENGRYIGNGVVHFGNDKYSISIRVNRVIACRPRELIRNQELAKAFRLDHLDLVPKVFEGIDKELYQIGDVEVCDMVFH